MLLFHQKNIWILCSQWRAEISLIVPYYWFLNDSSQHVVHLLLFQKLLENDADCLFRAMQIQRDRQKQISGFHLLVNLLSKPKQTKAIIKLAWSLSWVASVQTGNLLLPDR